MRLGFEDEDALFATMKADALYGWAERDTSDGRRPVCQLPLHRPLSSGYAGVGLVSLSQGNLDIRT